METFIIYMNSSFYRIWLHGMRFHPFDQPRPLPTACTVRHYPYIPTWLQLPVSRTELMDSAQWRVKTRQEHEGWQGQFPVYFFSSNVLVHNVWGTTERILRNTILFVFSYSEAMVSKYAFSFYCQNRIQRTTEIYLRNVRINCHYIFWIYNVNYFLSFLLLAGWDMLRCVNSV